MSLPRVSICITTWLEKNSHYLDAAIESIYRLDYPRELLDIVLVGKKSYKPIYPGVQTVAPDSDKFGNAEGVNFGVKHCHPDSEYLLLLNDDVILTKNCLSNMINASQGQSIVNATSPCDNRSAYFLQFGFVHQEQALRIDGSSFRYDDLKPYLSSLMSAQSLYPAGVILQDTLCMFATLVPRQVWNKLGPLDEAFKTGPDDIDYSIRARKHRVPLLIALDALIWHFGGVTSSETLTDAKRVENVEAFRLKHGHLPKFVTEESHAKMKLAIQAELLFKNVPLAP